MSADKNGSAEPSQSVPDTAVANVSTFSQVLGTEDRPSIASWDLTTPDGRELLQKCEETPDEKVRELVGQEIVVAHVYAKIVDYTNEQTSEVYPITRICLVTPEGKVHACAADGVRDSINRLSMGRGYPPWKVPVRVKVAQKETKKGRVRLVLLEVFPAKPKGGGK